MDETDGDESGRVCVGSRVEPISVNDIGKVVGEGENATPSAGEQVECGEAEGSEQWTQIIPLACGPRSSSTCEEHPVLESMWGCCRVFLLLFCFSSMRETTCMVANEVASNSN